MKITDLTPGTCAGCLEQIPDGQSGNVTVTSRAHTITVQTHENDDCRNNAHKNAMADTTWKADPTYRST